MRTLDPLDPLDPSARHNDDALERMARRRAGAKLGWMIHASVYVLGTDDSQADESEKPPLSTLRTKTGAVPSLIAKMRRPPRPSAMDA